MYGNYGHLLRVGRMALSSLVIIHFPFVFCISVNVFESIDAVDEVEGVDGAYWVG